LAGVAIANIPAVFILGTNNPLLVDKSSNIAVASGVVVPIPTLSCAILFFGNNKHSIKASRALDDNLSSLFFIFVGVYINYKVITI
jgi:hypothetical protein